MDVFLFVTQAIRISAAAAALTKLRYFCRYPFFIHRSYVRSSLSLFFSTFIRLFHLFFFLLATHAFKLYTHTHAIAVYPDTVLFFSRRVLSLSLLLSIPPTPAQPHSTFLFLLGASNYHSTASLAASSALS